MRSLAVECCNVDALDAGHIQGRIADIPRDPR
jgi:hypothetical protein